MSIQGPARSSSTTALMKFAGIFGIFGAASLIWTLSYSINFIGLVISLVLSALGAVFALRDRVQIAPWLFAASWLVWTLTDGLLYFFRDPVFLLTGVAAEFYPRLLGLDLWTTFQFLNIFLGKASILVAFILTLVAFIKTPRETQPGTTPISQGGLAVADENGNVPAGWYPDPEGNPSERYYNGEAWTQQSRPMTVTHAAGFNRVATKPAFTATGQPISPKSRTAAALLCWFLGFIGVHRFYVGKIGTGVAQIFTLGGLGIWILIDFIWILTGTWKDKEQRILANW